MRHEHLLQHRHHALLVALAGHGDGITPAGRRHFLALEPERFGDAQPRAVEQSEHGGVAREHPGLAFLAGAQIDVGQLFRCTDADRLRQRLGDLRRAHGGERADAALALAFEVARERAHACERAHQRAAADTVGAPRGEERAHVRRRELDEPRERHLAAEVFRQEGEELAGVPGIGLDRLRRHPLFAGQKCAPADHLRHHVGGGEGKIQGFGCRFGHRGDSIWVDRSGIITPASYPFLKRGESREIGS